MEQCDCCAFEYPALAKLCAGYLVPDWPELFRDADGAVGAFIRERPGLAVRLPDEIDQLLDRFPLETELDDLVAGHLRCGYWPPARGEAYSSWLADVADDVRGRLRSRRA